ncbi:hypothetical protein O6H91_14G006300 [Diphasiastrum complanatum]|uniref:Uncharacterized protein n=1 Tax=Diphasiastrum complanatum TaxID=34168 RepID=A0ACC2BL69_DIPCM|nr:hypothetical protein O6H91_Y376700 [Diphasiastrum complanatum]KAJ7530504.1 hypothetical protein O6H91_14G006300 [Diphasiastrum complanatum]
MVRDMGLRLRAGLKVEVSSDEDGFVGSWYAAKVLCKRKRYYAIQYDALVTDEGEPLVEQVLRSQLRPIPPPLLGVRKWAVGDSVEAYDNDGWWMGVVSKLLPSSNSFLVYFGSTAEEKEFLPSYMRPRQDWLHGKWVIVTQGVQGNVRKELHAMESEQQVAGEGLISGEARDAEQPECRAMGFQENIALQNCILDDSRCNNSEPKKIAIKSRKKPFDDGSLLVTQLDNNMSQTFQKLLPSTVLPESPRGSDSSGSSRETRQKRKKSKTGFSPTEEQGVIVPVCQHETLSTGPNLCLDGDKSLCLLESQSERLSKDTSSPPLQQIHETCGDKVQYVSCSAAKRTSQSSQKVEHQHYENRTRLQIATNQGSIAAGQVHPCHFCCRSCATADFPELESPSGNCGATRDSTSKLRTQNMELNAYVAVLQAFYSKGSLTWQQELLITDLRTHLHISSEEHLLQLLRIMSCSCESQVAVSRDSKQLSV